MENRKSLGAFILQRRKELGMTQKEFAQRIFVTDSAVSKWERGLSLPDVALLVPLADCLRVSVTELLRGERNARTQLPVEEVETLVSASLHLAGEEQRSSGQRRRKRGLAFLLCALTGIGETAALLTAGGFAWAELESTVLLVEGLCLLFGAWACFLAPEVLPFFVGVNLWEQTQGEKEPVTLSALLKAAGNVTEPLLEMSCLQSLNDVFDAVGYASSEGLSGLTSSLSSAAASYLTQAFPTILGQFERAGQDVRMTTYTEKNAFLTQDAQYAIGRISGRLPGLDYNQIPYIDAWGRTESTGGAGKRAADNFLNPAYTDEVGSSPMEDELMRLYKATGKAGLFPDRAGKYFTVDGVRKDLTAEEYVTYATEKGRLSYTLLTELTASKPYERMTDEQKVKAISEAYDLADKTAKASVAPDYTLDSWMKKAEEAEKRYRIPRETYVSLYSRTSGINSLRYKDKYEDKNGTPDAIPNSRSLLVMMEVYKTPGLNDKQRRAMFEYLGVGKDFWHWNKTLVQERLREMQKMAE